MEEVEYIIMYWVESSAMKYMKTLGLLHITNNRWSLTCFALVVEGMFLIVYDIIFNVCC